MSEPLFMRPVGRRQFLSWTGGVLAAGMVPARLLDIGQVVAGTTRPLRQPGSLPFPMRTAGEPQPDLAPELANIDHIIMVMMENHSFDSHFGMLPHHVPALAGRIDGWPQLDANGVPTVTQVDNQGAVQRAHPMPDGCQPHGVSNSWSSSHRAYDGGLMDGFLRESSVDALGYWDEQALPFYHSLASSFPVCDRYFSSTLCQTYPNRVFQMAGTAAGLTTTATPPPTVTPAHGHIFDVLEAHGISWATYFPELPTPGLFGAAWAAQRAGTHFFGPTGSTQATIDAFHAACVSNTLQSVVMVEPDYQYGSEENPQNIQTGQTFVAGVINALFGTPAWDRSLLVFTYDEQGGYYDHVAPPVALAPGDGSTPSDPPPANLYGDNYTRLGFRVPAVIVSPWARANFTSHTVYDHTSWLATIQRRWNLPALTMRDANANPLDDCLVSSGPPPFAVPPALAAAPLRTEADSILCERTGSDPLEPPNSVPEVPAVPVLAAAGVAVAAGLTRAAQPAPSALLHHEGGDRT